LHAALASFQPPLCRSAGFICFLRDQFPFFYMLLKAVIDVFLIRNCQAGTRCDNVPVTRGYRNTWYEALSICHRMFSHVQHVRHNGQWAQCKLTVTVDPNFVQHTTHQHSGRWQNEQQHIFFSHISNCNLKINQQHGCKSHSSRMEK
jgi:hypothetical protein